MPARSRGMYIMGENPAMSDPDAQHAREALRQARAPGGAGPVPDRDRRSTPTWCCRPRPGPRRTARSPTPTARSRWAAPPCRCRARRARTGDHPGDRAAASASTGTTSHPRDVFAEMARGHAVARQHHLGRGWSARARVTYPCDCARRSRATRSSSATASRRPAAAASSCPPTIVPPDELPDDDYPMVLTTGRLLEHWHTGAMTRRAAVLDAIEPEAIACLSPARSRPARRPRPATSSASRPGAARSSSPRAPTATCRRAWSSSRSATPRPRPTC